MSGSTEPVVADNFGARDYVEDSLRREVMGPDPRGVELDLDSTLSFDTWQEAEGPWFEKQTGEEILTRDPPLRRYGVGILFPASSLLTATSDEESALESLPGMQALNLAGEPDEQPTAVEFAGAIDGALEVVNKADDDEDNDLVNANSARPSAMAISCLISDWTDARLNLELMGGVYQPFPVTVKGSAQTWWVRRPMTLTLSIDVGALEPGRHRLPVDAAEWRTGMLVVEPFVVVRDDEDGRTLATFGIVNRTMQSAFREMGRLDFENAGSVFQAELSVTITNRSGDPLILPYTEVRADSMDRSLDLEEESIELLYRRYKSFAVGHGCSADWDGAEDLDVVSFVKGTPLPRFEVPTITTTIVDGLGEIPVVHMADLAGLDDSERGRRAVKELLDRYEGWIEATEAAARSVHPKHRPAADRHLGECRSVLERMREGLHFLDESPTARLAFELANKAVLLQQLRAGRPERQATVDPETQVIAFIEKFRDVDLSKSGDRGRWRPFQIAFLLASIKPTVEAHHPDRELVDLIFFPTGGGKTEAYLGLSAFSIFFRRLRNVNDTGTEVLMRYTLRLLTTQQFQRASALICAMEHIRRERRDLGDTPFRIGIWVGGDSTPNRRDQAIKALNKLQDERYAPNRFVILRCPWCSAQMGPLETVDQSRTRQGGKRRGAKSSKQGRNTPGYVREGPTVVLQCPDVDCPFHNWQLPIVIIDEDLYELRPDIIIGTVDKFAMLAWDSRPRAIFGIGPGGGRIATPPGLIIQDELHLISGPLGTVAGLFEGAIEELCSRQKENGVVDRPKIVSSTATIRNYEEQVRSLFARERTSIFPPRGIDISDSFFSRFDREPDGTLRPGRRYLGILWQGLGSTQTSMVRSFTSILQAPMDLAEPQLQDPWWTPLIFFGSLRELGGALSLFQSDILDYLKTVKRRTGRSWEEMRKLREPLELTGRMASDQVPDALRRLELPVGGSRAPVDVCLATNIIEVGVDIDRLSLMSIIGQPKTTAQYIQVSGRVGRRPWERPGLIVTIFSASRPRDRSHFERFRSFHERMYGQVEPTSVTPFSPPALERALHAALVAYVRNMGSQEVAWSPNPVPMDLVQEFRTAMRRRVKIADPGELASFEAFFDRRISEWRKWGKVDWNPKENAATALLRVAGRRFEAAIERTSWPTPMSMRSVDAECAISIRYLEADEEPSGVE